MEHNYFVSAKFDPQKRHRRSIRIPEYDCTSPGAYYITIVTVQRRNIFGNVINDEMCLNELGLIARAEWFKTAILRPYVELFEDEFVVMPNHVHGIIWILDDVVGARRRRAPTNENNIEKFGNPISGSIPTIIRAYTSAVTYAINTVQNQRGAALWQRNYYEHIIRDENDLQSKRDYIVANPLNWDKDEENINR